MAAAGVIIVNWNSGALLERCLTRLMAQTCKPHRIIVHDNNSNDGSIDRVEGPYPGVEFVKADSNIGFARANNLCVDRLHDCDWICLLNPDAFPEPGWLEALLRAAADYPDYDAFASLILQDGDRGLIDSAGDTCLRSGIAVHRFHGRPVDDVHDALRMPGPVFAPCAAAAMYRRAAWIDCGGFDDAYFAYYEDVDLGLRLALGGHRTLLVPGAVVYHIGGGTTGGYDNATAAYYGQRNFMLTYVKDMPAAIFWAHLPLHLWAILKGIGRGFLHRRGLWMLKASGAALLMMPRCLAARSRIQKARRIPADHLKALCGW